MLSSLRQLLRRYAAVRGCAHESRAKCAVAATSATTPIRLRYGPPLSLCKWPPACLVCPSPSLHTLYFYVTLDDLERSRHRYWLLARGFWFNSRYWSVGDFVISKNRHRTRWTASCVYFYSLLVSKLFCHQQRQL